MPQVFVAAGRNWRLPAPSTTDKLNSTSISDGESSKAPPPETLSRTDQFRFLDRAAIPLPPPSSSNPWRLCTITQVEEVKILLRLFPIILSTVFMNICLAQLQTFSIQQGSTLDTRVTARFRIPVSSLSFIPLALMSLLIPLYDRVFVPLARRITGIPTGIRHLQRIGVGLILSAISMFVAGFVERRRKAVSPRRMSVFWLGIQFGVFGLADMFTLVGLLEFFYAESGRRMRTLSTAVSWVALAMGYFGSTAVVELVNRVSGGWLKSDDLDRDKLEYFYWLLAGVSVVNFWVYLVCASWYRCKKVAQEGDVEEVGQGGVGKLDL